MRRLLLFAPILCCLLPAPAASASPALTPPPAAHAAIRSAVNAAVPHRLGRLLGAISPAGRRPRALHPYPVPQLPPGAQPTCPAGATQAPYALCFYGGSVLHSNNVYTVFWSPPGLSFEPGYIDRVNGYFRDVAGASGSLGNVYSTSAQYYDAGGNASYQSTFAGTAGDYAAFPSLSCVPPQVGYQCVSDSDLTAELDRVIAAQGWPRGLGPVYMVFLPKGASVCAPANGAPQCAYQTFCAYHSAYSVGPSPPTIYAVEPYAAVSGCDTGQSPGGGSADATINTASHEHNEAVTDPLGDGWLDVQGNENGDKCASFYGSPQGGTAGSLFNQSIGPGRYYLQEEFSNVSIKPGSGAQDNGCALNLPVPPPTADFAVPGSVVSGQPAQFVANISDPGSTVQSITWNFGDGAVDSGPSVTHTFGGTGSRNVVLTVQDALGLRATSAHVVQVTAPMPRAAFTVSPGALQSGRPATFDGSSSAEQGGAITSWRWDFDDGSSAQGRVVQHVFSQAGAHRVTLVAADSGGASAAAAQSIGVRRALLSGVGLAGRQRLRSVLRSGLRVRVRCSVSCRATVQVTIGSTSLRATVRHGVAVVRIRGAARRMLGRSRRLTVSAAATGGGLTDAVSRTLRLRR